MRALIRTRLAVVTLTGALLSACTATSTTTPSPHLKVRPTVVVSAPTPSATGASPDASASPEPTGSTTSVPKGKRVGLSATRVGDQRLGSAEDAPTTARLTRLLGEPVTEQHRRCRTATGATFPQVVGRRWDGFTLYYTGTGNDLTAVGWQASSRSGQQSFTLAATPGWQPRLATLLQTGWTRAGIGDLVLATHQGQPSYGAISPTQRAVLVFGGEVLDCS